MGTKFALNTAVMPTGDMILYRDANLRIDEREKAIGNTVGVENLKAFDANHAAEQLLGDTVYANVMMMDFSWQLGMIPVSLASLDRAFELSNVAVEQNKLAFKIGRVLAAGNDAIKQLLPDTSNADKTLDELIDHRAAFLRNYQNQNWGNRYRRNLEKLISVESSLNSDEASKAAARSLFKLMVYKDEYEVARLHTQLGFEEKLNSLFEGDFTVQYHLAPPLLNGGTDHQGRPKKRAMIKGIRSTFSILTKLKWLRGTPADPFRSTAERRMERELISWFDELLDQCCTSLTESNHSRWLEIIQAPMDVRGYGPVKEESIEKVKRRVQKLIDNL